MKKTKLPGDNISLKTKKTEDPLVMAWLNMQTNLMDSFRYLVENEIMLHGVRNLQLYIPAERIGIQDSGTGAGMAASMEADVLAEARQETAAAAAEAVTAAETIDAAAESEAPVAPDASEASTNSAASTASESQLSPSFEPAVADEIDEEDIEAWS
ncbi:hypothetical protein [Paenibacillus montanisoli]|uniref:hypothetical protein n=1 Tax=Paenibacillus montanisoli TaxID=2081970 RepID=UPI001980B8B5|nr:hypothetical protein [Paenibacillus montanisoli]